MKLRSSMETYSLSKKTRGRSGRPGAGKGATSSLAKSATRISLVRAILRFSPKRSQVGHDRGRVLFVESVLRHRRSSGEIVVGQTSHQEPDGVAFFPAGQTCYVGRFVSPARYGGNWLEGERGAFQVSSLDRFSFFIARRVTIAAHGHVIHQIFPTLELRWRRGGRRRCKCNHCQ